VYNHLLYSIDGPTEKWRKIFDLNVLGLSVCTKEALQSMKERGVDDGHIVHINRFVGQMKKDLWLSNDGRQPLHSTKINEMAERFSAVAV
jgi:NAD(P)-dependent dehydrogenase (short-subunit alcohol dehydrogenase family)